MADLTFPNSPQDFTFGALELRGELTGWSGAVPRRKAKHEFLKRPGGLVEDMAQGQRWIEARLVFTTVYDAAGVLFSAADSYEQFRASVAQTPQALLIHPIAGRWQAFCEGPHEDVDYARGIDDVSVRVRFEESELDAPNRPDVPDAATAAQNSTAQQSAHQQAAADFIGKTALTSTTDGSINAKINAARAAIAASASPIDDMIAVVTGAGALQSSLIGSILLVQQKMAVLDQSIANYVSATNDLFSGDTAATDPAAADTLLGVVISASLDAEAVLISASPTPAGAAEAVFQIEASVATCFVLRSAIQAARPPTVLLTVAELVDLITLCVRRYPDKPLARASDILAMNQIPNPVAIPPGTVLRVPSQ